MSACCPPASTNGTLFVVVEGSGTAHIEEQDIALYLCEVVLVSFWNDEMEMHIYRELNT